eukprot:10678710-Heterocapsa_arctica.AAC.1
MHFFTTTREFVDDVLVKTIGLSGEVVVLAARAIHGLVSALLAKDCEISVKTNTMGSSTKIAAALAWKFKRSGHNFNTALRARDLGVDSTFGRARAVSIAKARGNKSLKRVGCVAILLKTNKTARKLYPTGAQAQAMWGHQVHGTPPSRLESWRASAVLGAG